MRRNIRKSKNNNHSRNSNNFNIKTLIFIVLILIILLLLLFSYTFIKNFINYQQLIKTANNTNLTTSNSTDNFSDSDEKVITPTTFNLVAIGDVMCHNTQYFDAYNSSTGEYDFSYVFNDISYYTKVADFSIGSLETSFAGSDRGYSNYPRFNSPDNLAYSLKDIGIDLLSTAGNHCLDMGFSGLSRTIDVLDNADIAHTGTYKTQEDQNEVLIKYIKDVKVAFINYTYGTNGIPIPKDKDFCVNLIDENLIKKHIDYAKSQEVDMIIACMHWGTEYQTKQNSEQEKLSDFLFQNGVDIILGNHPHVLQPMEKKTITLSDGTTKDCFVIYALGNFICDQNAENTRNSIILNLNITKNADGKISINHATYTPIYMYKDPNLKTKRMKLIDIKKAIENYENGTDTSIGSKTYNYLKTQLNKITSIVGNEF